MSKASEFLRLVKEDDEIDLTEESYIYPSISDVSLSLKILGAYAFCWLFTPRKRKVKKK